MHSRKSDAVDLTVVVLQTRPSHVVAQNLDNLSSRYN